jgi:hypothetical protein
MTTPEFSNNLDPEQVSYEDSSSYSRKQLQADVQAPSVKRDEQASLDEAIVFEGIQVASKQRAKVQENRDSYQDKCNPRTEHKLVYVVEVSPRQGQDKRRRISDHH